MNGATVSIKWHLELVGDTVTPLLKQDRQIRASLTATDRLQRKLAKAAVDGARDQARGTEVATTALRGQGRQAQQASSDVERLNRAQKEALTVGDRLASSARRIADGYRAQVSAARGARQEVTRLQSAQARAAKLATGAVGAGGAVRGVAAGALARTSVLAGGGLALGAAEKDVVGFDKTIDSARAKLLITTKAMAPLRQAAIDLGAKTSFSAREAAGAIDELAAQGYSVNKIMRILPGTLSLAAASGTDLASAAAIQTETLHGFGLAARDAGKVADVLAQISNRSAAQIDDLQESLKYIAPVAKASGQSLEDMGAAIGLMANVGIKGSQAGTTLRTAMVRLANPTDKARGALETLHLKAGDLAGPKGLLSLPNIMGKIAAGAEGVSKNQRNAALATIFGREALSGMVALVEKGAPAIDREADALRNSEGAAKRAAGIMRNNVSGAWDNFTGSVESASIALLERFQPALKDSLNAAAGGINRGATFAGDVVAGVTGSNRGARPGGAGKGTSAFDPDRQARANARGQNSGSALGQRLRGIGSDAVDLAKSVGRGAADVGKQLLDAFKPALPFFQNVLLPLLKGIGEGVLVSVVGAFKVAVPVIKIVATALGQLGTWAKPLKPVFEGIGVVIGVVFAGPILKGVGALGKLASAAGKELPLALKLASAAARVLVVPINLLTGLTRGLFGIAGKVGSALSGPMAKGLGLARGAFNLGAKGVSLWVTAHIKAVQAVAKVMGTIVTKVAGPVGRAVGAAVSAAGGLIGRLASVGGRAVSAVVKPFASFGSRIANAVRDKLGDIGAFFLRVGKSIVSAIGNGIRSAPGAITGAISSLIPGPLKGAAHKLGLRAGGLAYADGGLVGANVSPGELVTYGASSWTVPGPRTSADSVFAMLPAGAAVWTGDGQARLSAGEDPSSVLRTQAPHFAAGGVVPGRYVSTSYGPPWTGINGRGVTAAGVDLRPARHYYGIATDPSRIPTGSSVYAWPNPFGYSGRFRAFDTGSAIKGNRVDFYDWRGRASQMQWGRHQTTVSNAPINGKGAGTYTASGGAGATPGVTILSASRRRSGLLDDALAQGVQAGQAGLLRSRIRQDGNPLFGAITQALTSSSNGKTSSRSSSSSSGKLPGGVYVPSGTWNPNRKPIARWIVPYLTYGASHGWSGIVQSGWRSKADQARIYNSGVRPAAKPGTSNHEGTTYPRGAVDVTQAPKLSTALSKRKGAHLLQWAGAKDPVHFSHPHNGSYRRGGIINFRPGGLVPTATSSSPQGITGSGSSTLGAGLQGALTFAGGSLESLDNLIGAAMQSKLEALRKQVLARVRAGGPQRVVQRLQSVLSLIDYEIGRRIGRLDDVIAQRTSAIGQRGDTFSRSQRRGGIDPASSVGLLGTMVSAGVNDVPALQANVKSAQSAVARAKRTGNTDLIRTETAQLAEAQGALDEALTSQVERWRDYLTARAQETVDTTTHSLSLAQGAGTQLSTAQRLAGLAQGSPLAGAISGQLGALGRGGAAPDGSAAALRQQADETTSRLIPALQAQQGALKGQQLTAYVNHDVGGFRSAELALQQNANDLATAVADAAQALRDAAVKAAQDLVDTAAHAVSLAQGKLTSLDAGQRLSGLLTGSPIGGAITGALTTLGVSAGPAADTPEGLRARSAAIQSTLLPSLQDQRGALENQLATATSLGDTDGIRSAQLALQQNANDLATAVGDAAQALRDASVKAAQDMVDQAGSGTTLANAGLQRLELEQKLAGTYDGGGVARADYIKSQVMPALQGELAALAEQEKTYREQGMGAELRQTIEAESAKQNELLQAQLDAQEAIEENTQPDRSFGGSLAFSTRDELVTDTVVTAALGI